MYKKVSMIIMLFGATLSLYAALASSTDEIELKLQTESAQVPENNLATNKAGLARNGTEQNSLPVNVEIKAINLTAEIIPVGVDKNYAFDVPEAQTVGWYKHSSIPARKGSTVLAAHVDFDGRTGAFFNLDQLVVGDTLTLTLDNNETVTYQVSGINDYNKTELPIDQLFNSDGPEVIQLITCGGTFDSQARSYRNNLVVTAKPINSL